MIIDCHGHYTTEPKDLLRWRKEQVDNLTDPAKQPPMTRSARAWKARSSSCSASAAPTSRSSRRAQWA